jgi:dolichol-phosphate mannosyltransferase
MPYLSIIIPVYNEAESLRELYREIGGVIKANHYDAELIFIDDGSTDESWQMMDELAAEDSKVQCIRFRRNFGKAAALRAGADHSSGQLIVTMDADLQDDPAEIPNLIAALGEDNDLISGWKKVRNDPLDKTLPSKIFNRLIGWLTGVHLHDHNCGFKVYRREIFDEVKLYGEMHRFVPVLAAARGFRVAEVPVNHRSRKHGVSKYGWARLPKGFLDLLTVCFLTGFSQRPQHLLGGFGLAAFSVGAIGLFWMAVYWLLRMAFYPEWAPLHQRPVVLYSLGALLLGAQVLCIGFLAELITSRNQVRNHPYSIAKHVGRKPSVEGSEQDG